MEDKMQSRIEICHIVTDLTFKQFLKFLLNERKSEKVFDVKPGDEVCFTLPIDGKFRLSCLGEEPEKCIVEDGVLRVDMPVKNCVLQFEYDVFDEKLNKSVTVIEVAYVLNS